MMLKKYISLVSFLFLAFFSRAQDSAEVTFEMLVSKEKLGINERLRVDFTMNKDGDDFTPPDFAGFKVLMGPSQSISSSWINGVRSYSKTYSYTLAPTSRGKFNLKQASIVIDGKTYKSLAKQIEVTAAVDKPNGQKTVDDVADESLHLVAEVSKTILKRVVLYPQKSGKLFIEPLSLDVTVDVPTNKRDFFGGRIYSQTNKTVSAGKRTINVKALPEEGKPANFSGAVGDFDFSVTTSKTSLNASESLQAKVEVNGKGNLKLFQLPEPTLPSSLEVYDPEFDEKVRTTLSGMQGKVSNSYTIVPSFRGKYPIQSISFSYFDPKEEKYKTRSSDEILINVLEGPTGAQGNTAASNGNKQAVIATGDKFNFIKLKPNLTSIGSNYFLGSISFYLWLLLPLLLIPLAIILGKKRDAIASDVAGNKIRRANKLARKYLSAAKKALGDKEAFYIALEKGLHNYLKAKLKIETSEFNKEKITTLLTEKEVDDTTKDGFIGLLKNCEMARYSPFSNVQMQQDYDKASEVISYLDKQL